MPSYQASGIVHGFIGFISMTHRTETGGRPDCLEASHVSYRHSFEVRNYASLSLWASIRTHGSQFRRAQLCILTTHIHICGHRNGKGFPQQTHLASLHIRKSFLSLLLQSTPLYQQLLKNEENCNLNSSSYIENK